MARKKGCRSKIPKQIVLDKNLCLMVNSLKMKDGPHVVVLGPLGKLEGSPVDKAVVVGEGGHHLEQKLNLSLERLYAIISMSIIIEYYHLLRTIICILNGLKSNPREGRLDAEWDHDACVEERRNWIRRSYDGKVPYSWRRV